MPQTVPLSPNPLAADTEKDSYEFGLRVLRGCYKRWLAGYGGESADERLMRFQKNRLYAAGKQPTEQFRNFVKIEGQIAVINLDYQPLAIAVPLLNTKKDRYMQRIEKIRCKSIGPQSDDKRKAKKDDARFKMNYSPAIQQLQQSSGMHLEDFSDHDPKSERELDAIFPATYRPTEEIIMQMGINQVFDKNSWDDVIKPRLIDDIWNCGFGVTLTELNGDGWIKTPFVKPEAFITSYSEFEDFNDWQWQGQRRSMSIMDIRQKYGNKIGEEELFELAQSNAGKYGNQSWSFGSWSDSYASALARPYDAFNVEVVDLYYKTLYNLQYEKVTNAYGKDRLKPWTLDSKGEQEKSKPYYVAYHGVWVIDTEYVLEWGLMHDMIKPNDNLTEIRSPYSIYMYNNNRCRNTPLVETMIPSIDMMQLLHLKSQAIIAMAAPDGFNIDILGLSNIDMGQGIGVVSPMQLLGIYLQTGNQYFMRKEADGDGVNEPPITPQNHQYSNKLEQLEAKFQAEYAKLQRIIGDNNLSAGNITNQGVATSTLTDAREMAESASNYSYNAYINIKKNTAKNVEILLLDKFFLRDKSFDGYSKSLGLKNIEYIRLEGANDFAQLIFDTNIEVVLDSSDQEKWDRRIEIALEQGQITIADVAELEMIEDPTMRAFMLAQRAKEKQANDMKVAQANSANNVAQATAGAQAKTQGDMATQAQAHEFKMAQMDKEQDGEARKQSYEFAGILKSKVADAILSQPGAKIEDVPQWIWDGLNITEASQKQVMYNAIKQMAAQSQQAQQQQPPQEEQGDVQPGQEQVAA